MSRQQPYLVVTLRCSEPEPKHESETTDGGAPPAAVIRPGPWNLYQEQQQLIAAAQRGEQIRHTAQFALAALLLTGSAWFTASTVKTRPLDESHLLSGSIAIAASLITLLLFCVFLVHLLRASGQRSRQDALSEGQLALVATLIAQDMDAVGKNETLGGVARQLVQRQLAVAKR